MPPLLRGVETQRALIAPEVVKRNEFSLKQPMKLEQAIIQL